MLKLKRRYALLMVVCVVGTQALRIIVNYFVGRALALEIPLYFYFIFIPVVAVAMMLPVSLNGYGVAEVVGGLLFSRFIPAVSYSQAGLLMFASHLALLIANFVCGLAVFIPVKKNSGA
jgi:hypothetical protein